MSGEVPYACQWACTALPASVGQMPRAWRASAPRFACTAYTVKRAVLAACRHCSVPVPRRPLSATWTPGAAVRTWAFTGACASFTAFASSWVAATRVPSPTGCPESSANSSHVLSRGMT